VRRRSGRAGPTQLEDAGEVHRARERLRQAGVRETEWQDAGGLVRLQVADPDGYRVGLFAYDIQDGARATTTG
jgi:hypothetical protein